MKWELKCAGVTPPVYLRYPSEAI